MDNKFLRKEKVGK